MAKNLVGEYYGRHMTKQEAYDLFPELDIIFVADDPCDINCEDITLYGVATGEDSDSLRVELSKAGIRGVRRISYENRDDFAGDFKRLEGFVGVQF